MPATIGPIARYGALSGRERIALSYFLVFIGAGIGGALRHGVNHLSLAWLGPGFPWGTLFVNLAGGLLIGAVAGLLAEKITGSYELRLFLTVGLLGGFTTFSAFSLEVALMWQRGEYGAALAYSLASVIVSVGAVFAGLALASR